MGWCHEFGVEIEARCSHPMAAGLSSCSCPECGTVCLGRFEGGCESVWERGFRQDAPARPATYSPKPALALAGTNGAGPDAGADVDGEHHLNGSQVEETAGSIFGSGAAVVGTSPAGDGFPGDGFPGAGRSDVDPMGTYLPGDDPSGPAWSDPSHEAGPGLGSEAVELNKRLDRVEAALTALTERIDRMAILDDPLATADGSWIDDGHGTGSRTRDRSAGWGHQGAGSEEIPVAVRAARALLADARKRAAVAENGRSPGRADDPPTPVVRQPGADGR